MTNEPIYSQLELARKFGELFEENYADSLERAAREYEPEGQVHCLLIGESPPVSGKYIYCLDKQKLVPRRGLPGIILKSLFDKGGPEKALRGHEFLTAMQSLGLQVIDVVDFPVDGFDNTIRGELIIGNLEKLKERLDSIHLSRNAHLTLALPKKTMLSLTSTLRKRGTIGRNSDSKEWILSRLREMLSQRPNVNVSVVTWPEIGDSLRKVRDSGIIDTSLFNSEF